MSFVVLNDYRQPPNYAPRSNYAEKLCEKRTSDVEILFAQHGSLLHAIFAGPQHFQNPEMVYDPAKNLWRVAFDVEMQMPIRKENPDYPPVLAAFVALEKDLQQLHKDYEPISDLETKKLIADMERKIAALKTGQDTANLKTSAQRAQSQDRGRTGYKPRDQSASGAGAKKRDGSSVGRKPKSDFSLPATATGVIYLSNWDPKPSGNDVVDAAFAGFGPFKAALNLASLPGSDLSDTARKLSSSFEKLYSALHHASDKLVQKCQAAVERAYHQANNELAKHHQVVYIKQHNNFFPLGTKFVGFPYGDNYYPLPLIQLSLMDEKPTLPKHAFCDVVAEIVARRPKPTEIVSDAAEYERTLEYLALEFAKLSADERTLFKPLLTFVQAYLYSPLRCYSDTEQYITLKGKVLPSVKRPVSEHEQTPASTPPHVQKAPEVSEWHAAPATQKAQRQKCECGTILNSQGKCTRALCELNK